MIWEISISTFCSMLETFLDLLCSQWHHLESGGFCQKAQSEESEMEGGVGGSPKGARSLWEDRNRLLKYPSTEVQTGTRN